MGMCDTSFKNESNMSCAKIGVARLVLMVVSLESVPNTLSRLRYLVSPSKGNKNSNFPGAR